MLFGLFLSFLFTNANHWFLLYCQRHDRKMTISYHAVHSAKTHTIYLLAHFFGGLFFLIFSYNFFYLQLGNEPLWYVAILGVLCEWAQAGFPARQKYEIWHLVFAWGMAIFMSVILLLLPFAFETGNQRLSVLLASLFLLSTSILLTGLYKRQRFWIPQMWYFFMFYGVMLVAVLAA